MTKKKYDEEMEEWKDLIDSRVLTDEERDRDRLIMLKIRKAKAREMPGELIQSMKLLQLKLQMESYINDPISITEPRFAEFLTTYVDTLYKKRKNFAADLSIDPMMLSQVLNNHRDPQDTFMYRLIIHSEASYKDLTVFNRELWPRVYYQDKVNRFITAENHVRETEEKYVTKRTLDG
ncbi:MAG: hypothetical protein KAR16_13220 [Bacteroidales bacterium]|nr:hypothetical protein [Bacteroidales bacterium]